MIGYLHYLTRSSDGFFVLNANKQTNGEVRRYENQSVTDVDQRARRRRVATGCVVEPARPPEPAPVAEVAPPPPAQGYRWVKGHYRWEGNHWQWIPGHWRPV